MILMSSSGSGSGSATTFAAMLVSTAYNDLSNIIDKDYVSDGTTASTTSYEPSTSSGYARQSLTSLAFTEDDTGNLGNVDASDLTFSAVSSGAGVIGAMIVFANTVASSSQKTLVAKLDTGFPVTPNGGDITVQLSTQGWLSATT